MSELKKVIMEMALQNLSESDDRNPKTNYPEYRGKKAQKYNGDMSKEERAKHHNNPHVGDTVMHGNTGDYGKVSKVTPTHVHVHYKGTQYPVEHNRNDVSFMHQHIHHDGKSHFQLLA